MKSCPLKVATYNIHRCYGTDGRYDPRRVGEVLKALDADLIGLQEVDSSLKVATEERRGHPQRGGSGRGGSREPTQLQYLSQVTGMEVVEGYLLHSRWGLYGNALLTRHPVKDIRRIDLSVRGGRERRGALDVGVRVHGLEVRVVVAHLGVQLWERHFQVGRLLRALGKDHTPYMVMMGDFNLWVMFWPRLRRFYGRLGHAPTVLTFPSRFPVLSLDRIWAKPAGALKAVKAFHSPLARKASDHLPLVGQLDFGSSEPL